MRGWRAAVPVSFGVGALATSTCGQSPADFVLVNRSDVPLAFAPGIIVAPCSEASYDESTLRAAGDKLVELNLNDIDGDEETWIPDGAINVDGVPPRRIGSPSPMHFVIGSWLVTCLRRVRTTLTPAPGVRRAARPRNRAIA